MALFWTTPLARPIPLLGETTIVVTLEDGAELMRQRFGNILKSAAFGYTLSLLTAAADSGKSADVETATLQLERFLRGNHLA